MIDQISTASIERLYKLNTLRDFLIENNNYLKAIGVLKIDAFGSVIEGVAKDEADLDIVFYLSGSVNFNDDRDMLENVYLLKLLPLLNKSGLVNGRSLTKDVFELHVQVVFIEKSYQQAGYARNSINVWPG